MNCGVSVYVKKSLLELMSLEEEFIEEQKLLVGTQSACVSV